MGKAKELVPGTFKAEVLDHPGVVVVDVYADWCGPCRVIAPAMDRLSERQDMKVVKVNLEANQGLCRDLGVSVLPTVLYFKDGKQAHKDEGVLSEAAVLDQVARIR